MHWATSTFPRVGAGVSLDLAKTFDHVRHGVLWDLWVEGGGDSRGGDLRVGSALFAKLWVHSEVVHASDTGDLGDRAAWGLWLDPWGRHWMLQGELSCVLVWLHLLRRLEPGSMWGPPVLGL